MIILFTIYVYVVSIQAIPDNIIVFEGEKINLKTMLGLKTNLTETGKTIETSVVNQEKVMNSPGKKVLKLSLFENIFLKNIDVDVLPKTKVIPVGNIAGIKLYGFVDVPADFYAQADVAINPVFQGTGLKIKTFEAISYDKVTLVHPHSMAGVFRKEEAPLLASDNPEEWVKILEKVWNSTEFIKQHKLQNKRFLKEMNEFIVNEYKRFLDA